MQFVTTRLRVMVPAIALLAVITARQSNAAPISLIDPGLSGTTVYDEWTTLTGAAYSGYPGFPGSGAWPAPMASQAGTGGAVLDKLANGTGGGPYPASSAIYYGGFSADINNDGGTLAVVDTSPLSGLQELAFQIQIGEAWTYDFLDHAAPLLSINSGSYTDVAATSSQLLEAYFNGTVTMPTGEEDVYINTYLYTWDLSGITDPITDFSISWTGVQHAQLYQLRLDQSDIVDTQAVPEPSSILLLGSCALFGIPAQFLRRRKLAGA